MKLLRFGPAGSEKPGILDAEGRVRDLSGKVGELAGEGVSLEALEANETLENLSTPGGWASEPLYPFETPYETRFKAQGLRIYYFEYRRRQEPS